LLSTMAIEIVDLPIITMVIFHSFSGWWFQTLWKIGVRQLGWWHSQYMGSHKIHVPNHQADIVYYNILNSLNIHMAMAMYMHVCETDTWLEIRKSVWKAHPQRKPMAAGFRSLCKSKLENPQFHMKKNMEQHGWNMDGTGLSCPERLPAALWITMCWWIQLFRHFGWKDRSLPRMKNQVWIMINNVG